MGNIWCGGSKMRRGSGKEAKTFQLCQKFISGSAVHYKNV